MGFKPAVHRMRTAFHPEKDASYLVRKANQKRLAEYMVHKPFGEGVGLAGIEGRRFSHRFTTEVPTDSHYVNIWVQFGIVGLCLHIVILLFIITYSAYLIMFRIRNRELKGMLIAMNCGLWVSCSVHTAIIFSGSTRQDISRIYFRLFLF